MSLASAFPPRQPRSVFSFGDGGSQNAEPPATGTLPGRRRNVTEDTWGGSLDEVLSSMPRQQPELPSEAPTLPQRPALPAPSRRPRATASDFGGALDEVLAQRSARQQVPAPPAQPHPPALPTRHRPHRAATVDDWGGGLDTVMQRPRRRMHDWHRDDECLEPQQQQEQEQQQQQQQQRRPLPAAQLPPQPLSQLVSMGFSLAAARAALEVHSTVDAAVEALLPAASRGRESVGSHATPPPPPLAAVVASRGPAATAAEWGGGLGDVLRPPAPARSSLLAEAARARNASRRLPAAPPELPQDEYYELMQMHLRDNVESAPAQKAWQQDWRCVLKLFKTVHPPSHARRVVVGSGSELTDEDEVCSICIEPLHAAVTGLGGSPVCALPCKHIFHRKCLTECVKRGHWTCPNCRDDLRLRLGTE